MNTMPAIYASLRSANFEMIEDELRRLEAAGVDGLHLDVMDGEFCDEVSFPVEQVARLRPLTSLPLDVHLMVARPEEVLDDWIALGVRRIAFHLEACPKPAGPLDRIRAAGIAPGLVVLPNTPVTDLEPWLDGVNFVNPLGVNPVEKSGYDEATPDRIRQLKALRPDLVVQADGGVWEKTRDTLVEAGADELVGGYPIFSKNDYKVAVAELRDGAA
jgi:ribulose-phosphate 3-epimerase